MTFESVEGSWKELWSRSLKPLEPPPLREPRLEYHVNEYTLSPIAAILGSEEILFCLRPRVILAYKPNNKRFDYGELLKIVVREACRVSWPASLPALNLSKRITEYQLAVLRAAGMISFIDIDSLAEGEPADSVSLLVRLTSVLEDRLAEQNMYVNQVGAMIIYGSHKLLRRVHELWQPRVSRRGYIYYSIPPPVEVRITEDKRVFKLVGLMYGLDTEFINADTLNDAVVAAEEEYHKFLGVFLQDPTLARFNKPAVDDEEARVDSAYLHAAVKAYTIASLLEAGYAESEIDTELMIGNIPVDILVGGRWGQGIIVEIETLYGSVNPATRLSTVIRQRLSTGYSLWIVIPPLQTFLYAKYIKPILSRYQNVVEFYTVNLSKGTLVPLREHLGSLDGIVSSLLNVNVSK